MLTIELNEPDSPKHVVVAVLSALRQAGMFPAAGYQVLYLETPGADPEQLVVMRDAEFTEAAQFFASHGRTCISLVEEFAAVEAAEVAVPVVDTDE
jgi:hypothetical protein